MNAESPTDLWLATERLALRPFAPADAGALHRLINDFEVCRNLAGVPFPYPRPLADDWIAKSRQALAAGIAFHFAITAREGEHGLLGGVGLRLEDEGKRGRIGYWVARRFWGRGIGREAVERVLEWAFATFPLASIEATVAADNHASIALLRRLGFAHVGMGRQFFITRNAEPRVLHFERRRSIDGTALPLPSQAAEGTDEGGAPSPEGAPAASHPPSRPLVLVAACALIDGEGRVLLGQRPPGKAYAGYWEFPGGKVEPGETPEQALIRELAEELGIDIRPACLAPYVFASHAYPEFHLLMPLYLCRRWQGTPRPREGQELRWVRPEELGDYRMPPADLPLVPLLRDIL
jgi:8-oxo-dGTP diphosphatase